MLDGDATDTPLIQSHKKFAVILPEDPDKKRWLHTEHEALSEHRRRGVPA